MTLVMVGYRKSLYSRENVGISILLCISLILFIGFRPHSAIFGDTINYAKWWGMSNWHGWTWRTENKIFDNIYSFMEGRFSDATEFFVLISIIYFVGILVACRKLFPANTLMTFVIYLSAFSTYSYSVNGIKAGAATALFLVALAYRDKMIISIIFLLLSWGFHHSMLLPVVAYILTLIFKNKNWYFYGWCFCLLMAAAHITTFQTFFAGFSNEGVADYLIGGGNDNILHAKGGFRVDFIIYSVIPIIMAYYVKYKYKMKNRLYDVLLNMYLTCNGAWMLCMYAEFTNRIAYLSWFMYPILLIYPCYTIDNANHPLVKIRKKVVLGHLAFTLFMNIIYYG